MRIAEIFHSVQGEGQFAGTPAVFVRTTGCNLRCWFCDARYTSWEPEGTHRRLPAILEEVASYHCNHVVITGGEPLLPPDVVPLTTELSRLGHFVTIETAATVDRPVVADLMSVSPKLGNSTPAESPWNMRHEQLRDRPRVLERLIADYDYQLKFVVDAPEDLNDVEAYLDRYRQIDPDRVYLMPQARSVEELEERAEWLTSAALERGFRFSPRLQVELYGNVRGR